MQIEFYKIVSQIIPTLFLAVSLQSLFISKGEKYKKTEYFQRNIHIMNLLALVGILILGEFVSLRNIYQNVSGNINSLIVVSISMLMGVFWIVTESILRLVGRDKEIYLAGAVLFGLVFDILGVILFIS